MIKWIEDRRPANTKKSYKTYGQQYLRYAALSGLKPDSDETLASFMLASHARGLARSTVASSIPAAAQSLFRFDDIQLTSSALVKQMKKAVAEASEPPKQKLPIELQHLRAMARLVKPIFEQVRNFCIVLFMTLGMLRESEAVKLNSVDVTRESLEGEVFILLKVTKSKTDQLRFGHSVLLASEDKSILCPVFWFDILAHYRVKDAKRYFHSVPSSRGQVQGLSTSTCFIVKKALVGIVENPSLYGSHSCRRGGVTAAVKARVDMLLIARHGNWRSTAVYLYVSDSLQRKLSVSKSILRSE